jgi:hypothetical protein
MIDASLQIFVVHHESDRLAEHANFLAFTIAMAHVAELGA